MSERVIINLFSEFIYIIALLLLFLAPHNIHSWDIAVANDGALNLFDLDGNIEFSPEETKNLTDLKALAYDPINQRLIFSVDEFSTSIFTFDLNNRTLTSVVSRQNHEVLALAYDFTTSTLYWTDGRGHTIWRKSMDNDTSPPQKLLHLKNEITSGIAISFCKRLLFWTNNNHTSGSIDRSNLDGTNHTKIITVDVFQPLGITVDEPYGKIYWTDDSEGIYYRIERSNLDGSDRELLIRRTHQEPFWIVAANNAIYWTDSVTKNVWVLSTDMSFPNHTKARLEPDIFHHYANYIPNGIAAYSDGNFECNVYKVPIPKPPETPEEMEIPAGYCLNDGEFEVGSCRCLKGFSGERCEVSLCHNYCLNEGTCFVNELDVPECKCASGFSGSRCDRDVCEGFCMNYGRCYVNDTHPMCTCRDGYFGDRCQLTADLYCHQKCLDSEQDPFCDCQSMRSARSEYLQVTNTSQCEARQILIISLMCFGFFAVLVIAVLARRICILRRRPTIKKRIIVNKTVKSQTPMTVRPNSASPTEQCEITIENCCNMNICETPCFEPNLRSSRSSSSKKTEDTKKLLKCMEEAAGEFNGGYS
ncbi:UNVERIFIED_CONTAM: hypothetical protein PYX00_008178 [Menopon gallinae]|uniref:Protein cueball n=1 Tax=Menopon gallinae TaxID=328185 RepID=A0AAW2HM01_9NEOP